MLSFIRKLISALPNVPRVRYNIFDGTTTAAEWRTMLRAWWSGGPYESLEVITQYEHEFAHAAGTRHAISFGAGRMALYAILEALDIGSGDEVVIPAFTCVVVPNAILYRSATPVYVDIETRSFNIDVAKVEAAITPRTKALYAQHTFGVPCDVAGLRTVAIKYGLPIIEDAAHALGAKYHGQPAGSLTEVAFFSTDRSKVINTYLGGMATTNDNALASRLRVAQSQAPFLETRQVRRMVRSFLIEYLCFLPSVLWLGRSVYGVLTYLGLQFGFNDELKTRRPTDYPYPCRLSSAQAQLGLAQLQSLGQNLAHRRALACWLDDQFAWSAVSRDELMRATWLRYSLLVDDRTEFERVFRRHFDLGVWFTSVVEGRAERLEEVGYRTGSCPTAEFAARHIVNLPTHLRIPLRHIQRDVNRNIDRIRRGILRPTTPEP